MEEKLNVLAPEVAKVEEVDKNNLNCLLYTSDAADE